MAKNEAKGWASGKVMRQCLSVVRGRISLSGSDKFHLGQLLRVTELDKRLNGNVLISAIRHRADESGWTTELQFGLSQQSHSAKRDPMTDQPATGLLPGVNGLQVGIVDAFEKDPEEQFRVRVKIPAIPEKNAKGQKVPNMVWARLASIGSGEESGFFFHPQKDDEVVLGFFNDDPRQAVILGSLHNKDKKKVPKDIPIEDNAKKGDRGLITPIGNKFIIHDEKDKSKLTLSTIAKHQIQIDDGSKFISLTTRDKQQILIDDKNKSIIIKDANKNSITLDKSGITLKAKALNFESTSNAITLKGSNQVQIEAPKIIEKGMVEVK